ncbi:hypothetical protein [Flavobacterium sp. HSC-61S13]|uniref:hypothetical protein n=1 Tax=Flavobacterium sp. HSC-61S13 TaxID=2910963 RepID=UPI00209F8F3F|nr:hypothetical protein [Flavobacterium sp. HSC-61S13]MCP1997503.1 hypothetical protein [Flavobacterium sp. HSC-61S13]
MKNTLIKNVFLCFLVASTALLSSCSDENLTTSTALKVIENYLAEKPVYETTSLSLGSLKLRTTKDALEIEHYKNLEKKGLISFEEESIKKKWLSKDSIWNTSIVITDLAKPYIIDQKSSKVTVKTVVYELDKDQPLQINNKSKRTANITVMLFKKETPFSILAEDKNPNSNFITRKFKLKYDEQYGWEVAK